MTTGIREHGPFGRVCQEIGATLDRAAEALQEFSESREDTALLDRCIADLHQVGGSLEILELTAPAQLARELEGLGGDLRDGRTEEPETAEEALMTGVLQLADLLERVQGGQLDAARLAEPRIQALRRLRGVEETADAPGWGRRRAAEAGRDLVRTAREQRPRYQRGLVQLLRGELGQEGAGVMMAALDRLDAASPDDAIGELWWLAAGLVDGIASGALEPGAELNQGLGQVDRQLRELIRGGEQRLREEPPESLLGTLRRLVEQAGPVSGRLRAIHARGQSRAGDESDGSAPVAAPPPGGVVLRGVAAAIEEDLGTLKDGLDMFARSGGQDRARLEDGDVVLRRLADTLGLLGLRAAADTVGRQVDPLRRLAAGEPAEEIGDGDPLLGVARAVVCAETCLDALVAGDSVRDEDVLAADGAVSDEGLFRLQQRALHRRVLREALAEMRLLKDAATQALDRGEPDALVELDVRVDRLAGALSMTGQDRPGRLLARAADGVRHHQHDAWPADKGVVADQLAEAIAAVECHLEALLEGGDATVFLERAETTLAALPALPPEEEAAAARSRESTPTAGEPAGDIRQDVPVRADSLDDEIVEVFLEEVDEVLASLGEHYPRWQRDQDDGDALAVVRRQFHTLKGSGRTAGALLLGETAWAVERLLNRVIGGQCAADPAVVTLVGEAIDAVPALVEEFRDGASTGDTAHGIMRRAEQLADRPGVDALPEAGAGELPGRDVAQADAEPGEAAATGLASGTVSEPDAVPVADDHAGEASPEGGVDEDVAAETGAADAAQPVLEPTLYAIFRKETEGHLDVVREFIGAGRAMTSSRQVNEDLVRSLHTLSGSARMAEVAPVATLGRHLEQFVCLHRDQGRSLDDEDLDLLGRGAARIQALVDALGDQRLPTPGIDDLLAELDRMPTQPPAGRPAFAPAAAVETGEEEDLSGLFLEEAEELLRVLEQSVADWEASGESEVRLAEIRRSLHTLKGGARLAGVAPVADLCHSLEGLIAALESASVPADDACFAVFGQALRRLDVLLDAMRSGLPCPDAGDVLEAIAQLQGGSAVVLPEDRAEDLEGLVSLFLEEAADTLQAIETALARWREEPASRARPEEIRRALHTLKGGARMVAYRPVADLAHAAETLLESVCRESVARDEALFELLERSHDRLHLMRDQAAAGLAPEEAPELVRALAECPAMVMPEVSRRSPEALVAAPVAEMPGKPLDQVRVRADLLDDLVNLAGEVSIYRARLEQQMGAFRFNLGELDQTVARVRDQLRALELETETQILYRHQREDERGTAADGSFDPLELDRFSRIQELSRALAESMNDLGSLQGLLEGLARQSETLLLQQSRVSTELQDGLMRTRMVPFAQHVPRLRRVVRQTAEELGRQAQLRVHGAQGEMDRTVLERIVAPLEHMLRNAVAHGIETPEARAAAGKPELGQVLVVLSREGSDVVLRVEDDGAGLDLGAIRERAVAVGLLREDTEPGDRELMRLVMEQGLSTASEVTQIAGRGVGMDVVSSEIKQLGGALEIDSTPGEGTRFTVRLPLTLAINQALLCLVEEQVYAIPLAGIDGVVRVPRGEMAEYLDAAGAPEFRYGDHVYQVMALGRLLGTGEGELPPGLRRVPLVLLRAGETRLAIQVDSLIGNREIVVKSVGPQISTVPGVLGATILGDGRVALILDVSALALQGVASDGESAAGEEEQGTAPRPTVMVVDDSITMRKVAGRLLERNNLRVIAVKDGVDAVASLQDQVPDAMLLDIEMPRMDGYELAAHMRTDPRLCQVPIIMVTSRTGEKHRQRARELGIRHYVGKPYQESHLLEVLSGVLDETADGDAGDDDRGSGEA